MGNCGHFCLFKYKNKSFVYNVCFFNTSSVGRIKVKNIDIVNYVCYNILMMYTRMLSEDYHMKKFITILLTLLMILSAAACSAQSPTPSAQPSSSLSDKTTVSPSVTQTPTPSEALIEPTPVPVSEEIRALGDYTVIYPETYENPRQMAEVELLCDVIEELSGKKPSAVSDGRASLTGKNYIIFASSHIKTEFDDTLAALECEMDYVICTDKDKNIILGGKTYYSDMRAAYDFINNYLGYDDIDDIYTQPTKNIDGSFVYVYEKPSFLIIAHNAAHNVFTKSVIRDAKSACFNVMTVDKNFCTEAEYMDIGTWCVRFEMYFMGITLCDYDTCDVELYCEDYIIKNPMAKYAGIRDEPPTELLPTIQKMADNFNAKYSRYGIKCFVNHMMSGKVWDALENDGYLSNVPITGFDKYLKNYSSSDINIIEYLGFLQKVKRVTDKNGQDFWMYLESYNLKNKGVTVQTSKTFRYTAYLAMCFGADAAGYFLYADATYYTAEGDWSHGQLLEADFTPTKAWYDAKTTNEELEKLSKIYYLYTNKTAYLVGPDEHGRFTPDDESKAYQGIIEEFLDRKGNEVTNRNYLVGCFDKKDGDGHAFIIMNLDELNTVKYTTERGETVKLKINGENVTFYQGGEKIDVPVDENGYYTPVMANGACIFVTVD